jgi:hypothetical protein
VAVNGFLDAYRGIAFITPILRIVRSPAMILWMKTPNMWRLAKRVISQCERSDCSAGVPRWYRNIFVLFSDLHRKVRDYLFDEEIRAVIQQHPTFTSHEIAEILHKGLL